jgi:hypothetical protein
MNITGSVLASWWHGRLPKEKVESKKQPETQIITQ